jgi:hypothetical protein
MKANASQRKAVLEARSSEHTPLERSLTESLEVLMRNL